MAEAPRLTVAEIGLFEREVRLRMPFRFGPTTPAHKRGPDRSRRRAGSSRARGKLSGVVRL